MKKEEKSQPRYNGQLSASVLQQLFLDFAVKERWFLFIVIVGFAIAGLSQINIHLAMVVGFLLASYPVIANDSIQTIGTFIASNRHVTWWKKWLFIGGIFIVTILVSWFLYSGDVSYERLSTKGFEETPTSFHYLQLAAPIFLLILTRLRVPVSTSLMILTAFATQASTISKVIAKSLNGYLIAFVGAVFLWGVLTPALEKMYKKPPKAFWRPLQWVTTGILWSFWWQQDAANVAIYLPRELSIWYLILFIAAIFFGLGLLIKKGGARIQKIVDQKSNVVDVRSATIIDGLYALILWYFKVQSKVPMSTTWVFLGLLAGRELMIAVRSTKHDKRRFRSALKIVAIDGGAALLGLAVSLIIGFSVNGVSF